MFNQDKFFKAKELKVDMLELDVHLTKDKKVVVFHDKNLKRISANTFVGKSNIIEPSY